MKNKADNEGVDAIRISFCRYSEDDGFPVMVDGEEVNRTILQICGEGYRDRKIRRGDVVEKVLGCFERRKPYKSYKRDFTPIAKLVSFEIPNVVAFPSCLFYIVFITSNFILIINIVTIFTSKEKLKEPSS